MESGAAEQLSDDRRGERAGHAIYGSIVVLAVIVGESDTSITVGEAIASVVGAAVITALAEIYADYIGATIRARRHPTEAEWRTEFRNFTAGFLTALLPVVFFIAAALDAIDLDIAFDLAVWTGVAVLGGYAVYANHVAGFTLRRSLLAGLAFMLLGAGLVALKAAA